MKCPYCGKELSEKKTYCPECGGKLNKTDNSKDDTLRLPDLSGVPLGGAPRARRTPPAKKSGGGGTAALVVVALIAAAVAAAAIVFIMREREPSERPVVDIGEPDTVVDEPDFDLPDADHRAEPEPKPEKQETRQSAGEDNVTADDATIYPTDEDSADDDSENGDSVNEDNENSGEEADKHAVQDEDPDEPPHDADESAPDTEDGSDSVSVSMPE